MKSFTTYVYIYIPSFTGDSTDNLSPDSGSKYSDDSPERSPSPKRSRVRDQASVATERGAVGGRLLPTVPQDVRTKKQVMWRQRRKFLWQRSLFYNKNTKRLKIYHFGILSHANNLNDY